MPFDHWLTEEPREPYGWEWAKADAQAREEYLEDRSREAYDEALRLLHLGGWSERDLRRLIVLSGEPLDVQAHATAGLEAALRAFAREAQETEARR